MPGGVADAGAAAAPSRAALRAAGSANVRSRRIGMPFRGRPRAGAGTPRGSGNDGTATVTFSTNTNKCHALLMRTATVGRKLTSIADRRPLSCDETDAAASVTADEEFL